MCYLRQVCQTTSARDEGESRPKTCWDAQPACCMYAVSQGEENLRLCTMRTMDLICSSPNSSVYSHSTAVRSNDGNTALCCSFSHHSQFSVTASQNTVLDAIPGRGTLNKRAKDCEPLAGDVKVRAHLVTADESTLVASGSTSSVTLQCCYLAANLTGASEFTATPARVEGTQHILQLSSKMLWCATWQRLLTGDDDAC